LTSSNISDFLLGSTCTGSFSALSVTSDGYLTIGANGANTQGRIIIDNVNATSVSISTNDGSGTCFSNPFNCIDVVPLKLESLSGKNIADCKMILNWKTGIESNIKNIEVQKSEDGVIFHKTAEISPRGSNSFYSFITTSFTNSYFRLKINDLDGLYEYSKVLSIKSNCNNIVYQVIPNPTSNSIEIIGLKNDDRIFIYDMLGRNVLTYYLPHNTNKIDIHNLIPGMYILQICNNNMIKSNLKFCKK
jgi:hypothetical protein